MKLYELLKAHVDYEVADQDDDCYSEVATINGRDIIFVAEKSRLLQGDIKRGKSYYPWEVGFLEKIAHAKDTDHNVTIQKTGSGGELQVFSFVKAALHRFIEKYSPERFTFSAALNEPSRVKLYTAFLKRFGSSGFHVEVDDIHGDRNWIFTEQ